MKILRITLLSCLVFLTAACGRDSGYRMNDKYTDTPAYGDRLVDSSIGEPATLNPVLASDSSSSDITSLVFNGLVRYDKDLNIQGALAERWEISPDSKTITFYLRKGVKWHDGEEFTSRDVKFTYDSFMNPAVKTAYRSIFEPVASVETPDRYIVKVRYKYVFAPALQYWGMEIIPYHLLKDKDLNTAEFNRKPVGTGPYKFVKWITADRIELEANPEYFEGKPYISRYTYRIIPDQSVQFMELLSGAIDMMTLTSDLFFTKADSPKFRKNYNKYKVPVFQYVYCGYNMKNPLFAD
ncbi:MAG TPA: ABC transporter substrate-binding protein, partial [Candidatus Goldiibacteriota bacterium]|nr:ABC transporter substrate-binding protein [Candidatus Goldiibacteriota bacterium]